MVKKINVGLFVLVCISFNCDLSHRQVAAAQTSRSSSAVPLATPAHVQQPAAKPEAAKPEAAKPEAAKPKFTPLKLEPKFKFVVQNLKFWRATETLRENGKKGPQQEAIFVRMLLKHKGPRPIWWGAFNQLVSLSFTTSDGKVYSGLHPNQGEDNFNSWDNVYVLYSYVLVPGLKKSARVVKVDAVFEIERPVEKGMEKRSFQVSALVPRNLQLQ